MVPKTENLDQLTGMVVDHLPEGIEERITRLETLLAVLPKTYIHRDEVSGMITTLRDHKRHQLEFRALLNGKAK